MNFRLARDQVVDLEAAAHLSINHICSQVDASFSPFDHPTQVNASLVTSIRCYNKCNTRYVYLKMYQEACESVSTRCQCGYLWLYLWVHFASALHHWTRPNPLSNKGYSRSWNKRWALINSLLQKCCRINKLLSHLQMYAEHCTSFLASLAKP